MESERYGARWRVDSQTHFLYWIMYFDGKWERYGAQKRAIARVNARTLKLIFFIESCILTESERTMARYGARWRVHTRTYFFYWIMYFDGK